MAFSDMTSSDSVAAGRGLFALLVPLCLPRIRSMPRQMRRAIAHRVAMQQFSMRGIARTKDRSGILIFVSLAERYAHRRRRRHCRARAASGMAGRRRSLVAHMRDGRIADGFVDGGSICAAKKLATHFPRARTNVDELPDRIYVI
jgi:putative membrane protein